MNLSRTWKSLFAVGIVLVALLSVRDTFLMWVPGAAALLPSRWVFVALIAASFLAAIVMAARASSVNRQSESTSRETGEEDDGRARYTFARKLSLFLLGASGLLMALMLTSSFLVPLLSADVRRTIFGVLFVVATLTFFGSAVFAYVGGRRVRDVEDELVEEDSRLGDRPLLPDSGSGPG